MDFSNWIHIPKCLREIFYGKSDNNDQKVRRSQASEYIIIYENFEVLAQKDPKAFEIAKSIFQEATDYWREQNIKMHILFIPSNGD
jgi:hypothetical protein